MGDPEAVALSNIFLRYAERVYIKLGSFRAESFEELFEGTRALPWSDFIGRDDAFPVKGHSIRSKLFSIPDCQAITKKAVVRAMQEKYGISVFPETGVKYQIEFFILNDEVTLMIDTSGIPLHKRGYRRESNAAPIRETLAAAIAATSRPRENVLFWDPMCGSGTIAIEAAMLMKILLPVLTDLLRLRRFLLCLRRFGKMRAKRRERALLIPPLRYMPLILRKLRLSLPRVTQEKRAWVI